MNIKITDLNQSRAHFEKNKKYSISVHQSFDPIRQPLQGHRYFSNIKEAEKFCSSFMSLIDGVFLHLDIYFNFLSSLTRNNSSFQGFYGKADHLFNNILQSRSEFLQLKGKSYKVEALNYVSIIFSLSADLRAYCFFVPVSDSLKADVIFNTIEQIILSLKAVLLSSATSNTFNEYSIFRPI